MALSCFERALTSADNTSLSDIWYNVSHICLSLGDVVRAQQVGPPCKAYLLSVSALQSPSIPLCAYTHILHFACPSVPYLT